MMANSVRARTCVLPIAGAIVWLASALAVSPTFAYEHRDSE